MPTMQHRTQEYTIRNTRYFKGETSGMKNLLCKWFGHYWVYGHYQNYWGTMRNSYDEFDSPICATCRRKKSDIEKGIDIKYCI